MLLGRKWAFPFFSPNESYFGLFIKWQFGTIQPLVLPCMSVCAYPIKRCMCTATGNSHKQMCTPQTSPGTFAGISFTLSRSTDAHCCTCTSFTRQEWALPILLQGVLSAICLALGCSFSFSDSGEMTPCCFLFSGIPLFYSILCNLVWSGLVWSPSEQWAC